MIDGGLVLITTRMTVSFCYGFDIKLDGYILARFMHTHHKWSIGQVGEC